MDEKTLIQYRDVILRWQDRFERVHNEWCAMLTKIYGEDYEKQKNALKSEE